MSETSIKRIDAQGKGLIRRASLEAVVRAFHKQCVRLTRRADGEIGISRFLHLLEQHHITEQPPHLPLLNRCGAVPIERIDRGW